MQSTSYSGSPNKTEKLAKRMVEIAAMNGMVNEVPPVPRLIMGTHHDRRYWKKKGISDIENRCTDA